MNNRKTVLVVEPDSVLRSFLRAEVNRSAVRLVVVSTIGLAIRLLCRPKRKIDAVAVTESMEGSLGLVQMIKAPGAEYFSGVIYCYGDNCNMDEKFRGAGCLPWIHRSRLIGALESC